MNCFVVPRAILGRAGVTLMVWRTAAVTVSVVLPETAPDVAVMTVWPTATDVARPLEPCALLIVECAVFDELQVTDAVRSWLVVLVPSE